MYKKIMICFSFVFLICLSSCISHVHNFYDKWTTNEHFHWHECIECEEITDKAEHVYEWKYDDDEHHKECVCGRIIEEKEHSFKENIIKPATTQEAGTKQLSCECGYSKEETIAKLDQFIFRDAGYKGIILSQTNISSETSITIPEKYNGYTVTEIELNCFSNCTNLEIVIFEKGVNYIGQSAFSGCSSLVTVELPKTLNIIGNGAFSGCSSLESITLPKGLTKINMSAFSGCESLKTVTIPGSVTTFVGSIFYECTGLEEVVFEEGFTKIGYNSFYGCTSLKQVTLPSTLNTIGVNTFNNCTSLTTIIFNGTKAEWDAISKTNWYANTPTITVKCTDGDIVLN